MRKLQLVLVLLLSFSIASYAQGNKKTTAIVKGRLINKATKEPFSDVRIEMPDLKVFTTSDGDGNFVLSEVPYGAQKIIISGFNIRTDSLNVDINGPVIDVKDISVTSSNTGADPENVKIPTIALEGSTTTEDNSNVITQTGSELVFANTDPFVYTAAYIFGAYRFEPRGSGNNQNEIQVNGIPLNDVTTGRFSTSQLGLAGLTDVFHGRDVTYGIRPSDYTFGGINGSTNFNITAADQRKGTDVTYTNSDRSYNNRIMFTESSGLMKNGWAYSVSGSRRWAENGYVPGTSFDGYAYYAAVSKVKRRHQFDLTALGSPTYQARAAYQTMEAYDLAGSHYYNNTWGYQNGAVRSMNTVNTFQPIFIADYVYKPSDRTKWTTSLGYQFGKNQTSVMYYGDGFPNSPNASNNASAPFNPNPAYYQNMPSYYLTMVPPQPGPASGLATAFQENEQIRWNDMYNVNATSPLITATNINGTPGNDYTGRLARYYLANRVSNLHKWTINENVIHAVNEHLNLSGGFTYTHQETEYYNVMTDLLGADFATNTNTYIPPGGNIQGVQNNLNDPNQIVFVGDKFDHDYKINANNGKLWGQAVWTYNKVELFAAVFGGIAEFDRDGLYRNGIFPDNSFGTSAAQTFVTYGAKGGITYKVNARHSFFLDASYITNPPTANNTYISPNTRNFTVDNPTTENTASMELGYQLKSKVVNARILGYASQTNNATQIERYFDDAISEEVNYVMQNVTTRSVGTELSVKVKVLPALDIVGVAAIGEAYYASNPVVSQYSDDDPVRNTPKTTTYIHNYYLGNGPQSAYTLAFNVHPSRSWYVDLNFNYLDRNYVAINPTRRIEQVIAQVPQGSPLWHEIFDQEELPSVFTVDLHAGYTWQLSRRSKTIDKISHRAVLILSGNVNNLLNNTNIINSGYEQLRFDYGTMNPAEFANKYLYGYGINYYVQLALRF